MTGALIIALITIAVGLVTYIFELRHRRRNVQQGAQADTAPDPQAEPADGECCGQHLVCEKETLSPMTAEIIYYDDEELDRFQGRDGSDYTPDETEEFRDVLMTLRPEDVTGWARSITQRRLNLPPDVRDELLLLVNDQRAARRV